MKKRILKFETKDQIVFAYQAKEFPLVISPPAKSFVSSQGTAQSDFKISPLAAEQSGIARLQREALNDRIEEEALQKLKDVEEKAYKEAYELGLIEGREKAFEEQKATIIDQLHRMSATLESIENMKSNIMADHEAHIMRMIFELASRMAMREIRGDPASIVSVVQQIVGDTQSDEKMTLRMAPEDLRFFEEAKDRMAKTAPGLKRVRLESQEGLSPGGCVIETNYGLIDATVEKRIERAWQIIDERLPKLDGRTSAIQEES